MSAAVEEPQPRTGDGGSVSRVTRRFVVATSTMRISPPRAVADFSHRAFSVASNLSGPAPRDAGAEAELAEFAVGLDILVVDTAPRS